MTQKPYLNLGCGRIILPGTKPVHYGLIDDAVCSYPLWHNVDRNAEPGVDEVVDIFRYPFPWADNSFDGALCAHIVEHIPHDIRIASEYDLYAGKGEYDALEYAATANRLRSMQDGWYAFFHELWRVLTPGSIIHVLSPYAWSAGAVTDPTHTRLITEHTFTHSMQPDERSPFRYETGGLNLEQVGETRYTPTGLFHHLRDDPYEWTRALQTRINVVYEIAVQLKVIK